MRTLDDDVDKVNMVALFIRSVYLFMRVVCVCMCAINMSDGDEISLYYKILSKIKRVDEIFRDQTVSKREIFLLNIEKTYFFFFTLNPNGPVSFSCVKQRMTSIYGRMAKWIMRQTSIFFKVNLKIPSSTLGSFTNCFFCSFTNCFFYSLFYSLSYFEYLTREISDEFFN